MILRNIMFGLAFGGFSYAVYEAYTRTQSQDAGGSIGGGDSFLNVASDVVSNGFLNIGYSIGDIMQGTWIDLLNSRGEPYKQAFADAEKINNIPTGMLARLGYQESRYKADAYNKSSKATGIMQIVPRWHPNVDATDPFASIAYSGKFLRQLYNQTGSWELALKSYNWGLGNVKKWLKGQLNEPLETKLYSAQILADLNIA